MPDVEIETDQDVDKGEYFTEAALALAAIRADLDAHPATGWQAQANGREEAA